MHRRLSQKSIDIIKSSGELITLNDTKISKRMYEILFSKYPETKKLFKNTPEERYMKLAEILSIYAVNIDKLNKLGPALEVIASSHTNALVQSGNYPMVGIVLMQAIEDVLGEKASIEFMDAWREAFKILAGILINLEKNIYEDRTLVS